MGFEGVFVSPYFTKKLCVELFGVFVYVLPLSIFAITNGPPRPSHLRQRD